MPSFCFDIETLGVESTSVVLSAAITHFDYTEYEDLNEEFERLVKNSLFVKFDSTDQIERHKRTVSKSTLEWWSKQSEVARKLSFNQSERDVSAEDGLGLLRSYIRGYSKKGERNIIWVRGPLDQIVIESLVRCAKVEDLEHYSNYRDVRTAVDLLAETSNGGYCKLRKPFNRDAVMKHHPSHDIALDILQLKYPL